MKYFKNEYWALMNSADSETRQEGILRWNENSIAYLNYFETIKNKLSKTFLALYYRNNGFHDGMIKNMSIEYFKSRQRILKIRIMISKMEFELKYLGVQALSITCPPNGNLIKDILYWGYDELELKGDSQWNHRIFCANDTEFDIVCKRISIKKVCD
jgi:hypothetical protein